MSTRRGRQMTMTVERSMGLMMLMAGSCAEFAWQAAKYTSDVARLSADRLSEVRAPEEPLFVTMMP